MAKNLDDGVNVERLLDLAADRSRAARNELSHAIVDLFLPERHRLTDHQRAMMTDVLRKLIGSLEIEVRQYLVEALLRGPDSLPELQAVLANDEIEVAQTILERSRVLQDQVLIDVVRRRAEEHRMAVAVRNDVSAAVAEALVEKAGPDVIEALIRNPDASLSRHAMEMLVAESKRFDRFQEPLLARADLPPELAYRMYWWVSAALRDYILKRFEIDPTRVDSLIQSAARRGIAAHEIDDKLEARAMRLAERLNELGDLTDDFLRASLRQSRISLFVAGLAVRAGIDFATSWIIVSGPAADSVVVLFRSIGMNRDMAASILMLMQRLRDGDNPQSSAALVGAMEAFDKMPVAKARSVLQLWQLDPHYRDAIDEVVPEVH